MSGCSKRQKQKKNKKQNLIQHILSSAKISISETNELQQETQQFVSVLERLWSW